MADTARRILLNTGYRVFADVGAKLASIVLYIVMARQLGASEFGVFAFGLSFVTLVTALADFGQDRILTREVARDHGRANTYFANTLCLKLTLAVPVLIVAVAVLAAFATEETTKVAALLGVAVVVEQMMATCFALFQAHERLVFVPVALIAQRLLTAVWGISALLAGRGVVFVSAIYLVGALVGLSIALSLLLTRVVRPRFTVTPRSWPAFMLAALPIGAAGVFATMLYRADIAMLALFQSPKEVGEYAAAFRLFETTLFVSWGVGAAIYPVFSRLTVTSSPPVTLVFEKGVKLACAVTIPLAVGAAILAAPLIDLLYGSEFAESADALVLLAPAIAVHPIAYLAGYVLVSQDRQRTLAPVYAVVAAENILLNLVLIPAYSLDGAAIGTSISEVIVAVALTVIATRLLGGLNWSRALGGPVIASVICGAAMLLLRDDFFAAVAVGALAYISVLLVFERLVYPEDVRTVRSLWARPVEPF